MIRRAFRRAFDDHEVEDIYSNAWLGTLRASSLATTLSDEEIRKYVLAAVANHASKELRRRKRRPTTPLDAVHAVADDGLPPDEHAVKLEDSRLTRDLLSSLPPRRRAVMLLRYGWGLEPRQVCGLVEGLSPRAYRKEITRGIDELTDEAAPGRERRVVCGPRAGAEGVRRRPRGSRTAAPGTAASLPLPPMQRVRRQAERPPSRHRRFGRCAGCRGDCRWPALACRSPRRGRRIGPRDTAPPSWQAAAMAWPTPRRRR